MSDHDAADPDPDAGDSRPDAADPDPEDEERTTIRGTREFEREYRLDAGEAGEFLVALGERLRAADELTIVDGEWELPFAFGEPVELEVDYDGVGEPELEVELGLPGRTDESAPAVE